MSNIINCNLSTAYSQNFWVLYWSGTCLISITTEEPFPKAKLPND